MRHLRIIGRIACFAVCLAAAAPLARAQVTPEQNEVLTAVAKCLLAGLPQDWYEARVTVTMDEPGAANGSARYEYSRQLARDEMIAFTPCTWGNPARGLAGMRRFQPEDRQGWKSARFVLHRDGKFDLTYDYPKKE